MARWAIAIHGGAGVDPNLPEASQEEAKRVLARCLQIGVDALRAGSSALDVVEAVVRELETDPFLQLGPWVGAHPPRHRRDGGQHHGRPRPPLRRRLRHLHR
ncbi:hypothetical protein PR202_gb14129 [Eleusine coracana subsp. coracana]|uniref:L-asparaginase n=1 Tax=Eleusine coracana subsp. coracana TaxID=191504 RepID=A0AAV5EUG0_ELECO|nr:hypothetical protein PR202_gb14129 [Eleusine coracana subsp. coracana]